MCINDINTKLSADEKRTLRGFIDCPKCTRKLTASASKGRKFYYHYYHCQNSCAVRFKAEDVNNYFDKQIKHIDLKTGYEHFNHQVLPGQ